MRIKLIIIIIGIFLCSCVSIPKETVELSSVLGNDLEVLKKSHKNMVELYYTEIIDNINTFIDEVYSPFVIHYVLKAELEKHVNEEESLFGVIEDAGKVGGKEKTENALQAMTEFIEDAQEQIESKRKDLLAPIVLQKNDILCKIEDSYKNVISANITITGYLKSIKRVRASQQEALSMIGLHGLDEELNETLLNALELTKSAVRVGEKIDIKSDEAYSKIKEISDQIEDLTEMR